MFMCDCYLGYAKLNASQDLGLKARDSFAFSVFFARVREHVDVSNMFLFVIGFFV